jgi:hypothetical protein
VSNDIPSGLSGVRPPPLEVEKPPEADRQLYSVTSVINASTGNEGLVRWCATETAKAAVSSMKTLYAMIENQGEEIAIDWLEGARNRGGKGQRSATALGTEFHSLAERWAITGERPDCDDEMRPYLDQYDRWLQVAQPEFLAAEMTVYNPDYGYAGTADVFLIIDGMPLIVDYKTSKKPRKNNGDEARPYATVGLQLAAYRHAQFAAAWRVRRLKSRRYYLLGEDERQMAVDIPAVEGGLAVHVTMEHCNAHPIRCDEAVHEQFLYMIEAARFEFEMARTIVGEPLVFPDKEAVAR